MFIQPQKTKYHYRKNTKINKINSGDTTECGLELSDLKPVITAASVPQYITVPYTGRRDGTSVNGIRINQPCGEQDEEYEICFDKSQVGGVQAIGTIGLRDDNGQGDSCQVRDTLPDFCGGVTPDPTPRPTDRPTTSQPTASPTDRPTTSEPSYEPTEDPTTSSYVLWFALFSFHLMYLHVK